MYVLHPNHNYNYFNNFILCLLRNKYLYVYRSGD